MKKLTLTLSLLIMCILGYSQEGPIEIAKSVNGEYVYSEAYVKTVIHAGLLQGNNAELRDGFEVKDVELRQAQDDSYYIKSVIIDSNGKHYSFAVSLDQNSDVTGDVLEMNGGGCTATCSGQGTDPCGTCTLTVLSGCKIFRCECTSGLGNCTGTSTFEFRIAAKSFEPIPSN